MLFDFSSSRKTTFAADPPPRDSLIARILWYLQLSLTKWVGLGRTPLFEFAYCLFAVKSRLVFNYKTGCLQERQASWFFLELGAPPMLVGTAAGQTSFKGMPAYFSQPLLHTEASSSSCTGFCFLPTVSTRKAALSKECLNFVLLRLKTKTHMLF